MLIDLTGRTALVTGAGRSVGRGIAEVLASAGAFVYVNDLHEDRAAEVVAAIKSNGNNASAAIFDVTDPSAIETGLTQVEGARKAEHPGVDGDVPHARTPQRIQYAKIASDSGSSLQWLPPPRRRCSEAGREWTALAPGAHARGRHQISLRDDGTRSNALRSGASPMIARAAFTP